MVQKRSTIKDVASEARVAISTVSLVINRKGYVSTEVRERVLGAARRLNYVPTRAARGLASRTTGNLGFVVREDHFTRSEPFYTRVFLGTEFEAHNHNLYVLLTTVPGDYRPEDHTPRFLREHNVDGVVIAGKVSEMFIDQVAGSEMPFVLVDFEVAGHPAVMIDNVGGARSAVEHLVSRGHRRIAFLGTDLAHPSLAARLSGYQAALAGIGLSPEDECVVSAGAEEPVFEVGLRLGEQLLDRTLPPTAVFCANDALALGVLRRAHERGVQVPEALAVVGFDDVAGAATAAPPLTTIRVHKEQLGEAAVRRLSGLIAHGPTGGADPPAAGTTTVPTELVVRAST